MRFSIVNSGRYVAYRRGIPCRPKMNCGKKVTLKPTMINVDAISSVSPDTSCPTFSGTSSAVPREGPSGSAHHHVMKVSDDEISLRQMNVDRERREKHSRQPPDREKLDEADHVKHRRIEMDRSLDIVQTQRNLIPVGTATNIVISENTKFASSDCPLTNM